MRRTMTAVGVGALLLLCACPLTSTCGPSNCPTGCCRSGSCLAGDAVDHCGAGGEICKACASSGQGCAAGVCVPTCGAPGAACPSEGCCAGLDCRSGQCQAPVACVPSAGACASVTDCCADLTCASGACAPCGQPGQPCCGRNPICLTGTTCRNDVCATDFHDTGTTCSKNADCTQGLCLALANGKNACTIACAGPADCLGGWDCQPLSGVAGQVCQCTPKAESCNGKDDDCNSWVDDGYLDDECQVALPGSSCKAGACACPEGQPECEGRCTDLAWTDEHCASCDHSCLAALGDAGYSDDRGAACFASQCRGWEKLVARGLRGYGTLLVVDGMLFLTVDGSAYSPPLGTLESCAATGCGQASTVRASGLDGPRQMAAWSGDVYFATEAGIERFSPATGKTTVVATETDAAGGVTISGATLAWASLKRDTATCSLKTCTLPACADVKAAVSGECAYGHLVSDATHFYWSSSTSGTDYFLERCALAGCAGGPEIVHQGTDSYGELAVDGARIYWTGRSVWSCPVAGCGAAPTLVSDKTASPWGLAVDAANVYWADDGYVLRCPKAGCTGEPERLARQPASDYGRVLTLDAASIYWATEYAVWKAAK